MLLSNVKFRMPFSRVTLLTPQIGGIAEKTPIFLEHEP